jgi:hypothetical protein
VGEHAVLCVATSVRPWIEYVFPRSVDTKSIACLNIRSATLSCFDWGAKNLSFDEPDTKEGWLFDETLKSRPCMNVMTASQVRLASKADRSVSRVYFSPSPNAGDYFMLGCAEVFVQT